MDGRRKLRRASGGFKLRFMSSVVVSNREILGGTPVFAGTRVPVRNFIDCLEGGYTIDEFLEDFTTVTREQVIAFLEDTKAELELAVPA